MTAQPSPVQHADLAPLLRKAGAALVLAEVRYDLVFAIEKALGERVARPEPPESSVDKMARRCADMARVAAALKAAGKPMLSSEIAAAAWPGIKVAKCRGYLSTFFGYCWLEHGDQEPGDRQAQRYALGRARDWQDHLPAREAQP
jgi:hypothetical protein